MGPNKIKVVLSKNLKSKGGQIGEVEIEQAWENE